MLSTHSDDAPPEMDVHTRPWILFSTIAVDRTVSGRWRGISLRGRSCFPRLFDYGERSLNPARGIVPAGGRKA
jgi:hypothetical protein